MRAMESTVVWINTLRNRIPSRRWPPENVLLLLPHCLQRRECKELVKEDIRNCKGCGRCKVKQLRELAERRGVQVYIAAGGREAVERARRRERPRRPRRRLQQGTLRRNPRRLPETRRRRPQRVAQRPVQGHRRGPRPGRSRPRTHGSGSPPMIRMPSVLGHVAQPPSAVSVIRTTGAQARAPVPHVCSVENRPKTEAIP